MNWGEVKAFVDQSIARQFDLEKENKESFEKGVVFAIKALRNLKESDIGNWSHSRDLKFAPVELSDYILIKYKKEYK